MNTALVIVASAQVHELRAWLDARAALRPPPVIKRVGFDRPWRIEPAEDDHHDFTVTWEDGERERVAVA